MAVFDVAGLAGKIDFGATGYAEIAQNVRTILLTMTGTVPLDRDFPGMEAPIDLPMPAAQAKFSAQLYQIIQKHEPRVKVRQIKYVQTTDEMLTAKIVPVVTIEIIEE